MQPSNELHQLIHSLTKSEKRFFKLHSSLQEGEKNYLKIFDAIDAQDFYDESALKEEFSNETFIRHLPSEKNHLYKQILKALRSYHAENSISAILTQELKNIEILYNKGLFKECNKFILRAKKIALTNEKFSHLFELISWEKILLEKAFEDGEFTKDLHTLIEEEQEVQKKIRNLAAYHGLYSKVNYVFSSGGFARDDESRALINEIAQHPLIVGKNTALSNRAASICYYTQGYCALAHGDFTTALLRFRRVKDILDAHPNLREDLATRYIKTLANIISCTIDNGNYNAALEDIAALLKMRDESGFENTDMALTIFKTCSIAELRIFQRQGLFKEALPLVERILEGMERFERRFAKEQEISFYFHIAYTYFGMGNYSKALAWINKVLNDNEDTLRQDVYSYARIFNLFIHFELGNGDLLEYTTKSTQRYLSRRQRDFQMELLIIDYLRRLIRSPRSGNNKKLFGEFKQKLSEVAVLPEDQIILRYFDVGSWIDSKMRGTSFSDAVRERAAQETF
jgi:tetratricopeptide (TPR) repeat protein